MHILKGDTKVQAATINMVLADYQQKFQGLGDMAIDIQARRNRTRTVLICLIILLIVQLWMTFVNHKLSPAISALPLIGIALAFRRHEKLKATSSELADRAEFYQRGIDRLTGAWQGNGATGEEFARPHHLYQWDLDIFGKGSLFELLCTTRSEVGAERLASYLLDPVNLEETRSRQSAVKELKLATALREEIALLGKYNFQDCSRQLLRSWLNMPLLHAPRSVSVVLLTCSILCASLGILGLTTLVGWSYLAPFLIPLAMMQFGIAAFYSRRVRPLLENLEPLTNEFTVLLDALELMEHREFCSPKLLSLVQEMRCQNASSHVRKLQQLVGQLNRRKTDVVYLPALFLAVGTQIVLALERWRCEHQEDLKVWLDCWAEFDALNALASYAHEHPENVFPEFTEEAAIFEARNLGHPLLADDTCIGNDVVLNPKSRFYLISGSNMAGKSTFLRAIGMNAVLAYAGAPVRAINVRMSQFAVCASISISDSILEGKSKFMAEVERLKATIDAMQGRKPVLFLIDEILSGTNSRDRRLAAEAVIRCLIAGGAIGVLSTHDTALSEIANVSELRGCNVCMEGENPKDPLEFNYLVKAGISKRSNALAIVEMLGISPIPASGLISLN